jgi:hypothetical protein
LSVFDSVVLWWEYNIRTHIGNIIQREQYYYDDRDARLNFQACVPRPWYWPPTIYVRGTMHSLREVLNHVITATFLRVYIHNIHTHTASHYGLNPSMKYVPPTYTTRAHRNNIISTLSRVTDYYYSCFYAEERKKCIKCFHYNILCWCSTYLL